MGKGVTVILDQAWWNMTGTGGQISPEQRLYFSVLIQAVEDLVPKMLEASGHA